MIKKPPAAEMIEALKTERATVEARLKGNWHAAFMQEIKDSISELEEIDRKIASEKRRLKLAATKRSK